MLAAIEAAIDGPDHSSKFLGISSWIPYKDLSPAGSSAVGLPAHGGQALLHMLQAGSPGPAGDAAQRPYANPVNYSLAGPQPPPQPPVVRPFLGVRDLSLAAESAARPAAASPASLLQQIQVSFKFCTFTDKQNGVMYFGKHAL